MRHLLVTNDFPPKIGGIQHYLWELWRRLPPGSAHVLTTPYAGTDVFDAAAAPALPIVRSRRPVLLPTPGMARGIAAEAARIGAGFVVLDPAVPLGALGPTLARRGLPYAVVLHGAEVTVPGRLPASRALLGRVLRDAVHVIAAGGYPLAEAEHCAGRPLPATVIPPGVDTDAFVPADAPMRARVRARLGVGAEVPLVVSTSRLVPRKGMDTLIAAADRLSVRHPDLVVAIAGGGRDRERLELLAGRGRARVQFLGRLADTEFRELVAAADVYAMCCRDRWAGLEQEGYGIVFVEAAAAGVPQVAGESGGSAEAVVDGVTGFVVPRPVSVDGVAQAIGRLLDDPSMAASMGAAARRRAVHDLSYDVLADRLRIALDGIGAMTARVAGDGAEWRSHVR